MFTKYEVGQIVAEFRGHAEKTIFDISDGGAAMVVFFKNPKESEVEQFKSGKSFEIRFLELYDVIMITAKIGGLNWMDAPYTPHLSRDLTKFEIPSDGQGLSLMLMLVDADTGEVKHIRLIGLSENFTRKLIGAVMEQKMNEFSRTEYDNAIRKIFSSYKTSQIVKLSKDYCKIND